MLRSDGAGLVVVVLGARGLADRLPVRMMAVEPRPHALLAAAVRAHRGELGVAATASTEDDLAPIGRPHRGEALGRRKPGRRGAAVTAHHVDVEVLAGRRAIPLEDD